MSQNVPATTPEAPLVVDEGAELHAGHHDPQHQEVRQNLRVALLPLALVALLVLTFVAVAWTFLAAQPPAV